MPLLAVLPAAASPEDVPARILPFALPRAANGAGSAWISPGMLDECPRGCLLLAGGGAEGTPHASLTRVRPHECDAETLAPSLREPRWGAAAAWDGAGLVVMGGYDGRRHWDLVERWDAGSDTVSVLGALPRGLVYGSAFFDPRPHADGACRAGYVYLIGGVTQAGDSDLVVRVDLDRDEVRTLKARLPEARADMGVAWDGERAYLFGGRSGSRFTDEILRFDPLTGAFETMAARLPSPREYWASRGPAAWPSSWGAPWARRASMTSWSTSRARTRSA